MEICCRFCAISRVSPAIYLSSGWHTTRPNYPFPLKPGIIGRLSAAAANLNAHPLGSGYGGKSNITILKENDLIDNDGSFKYSFIQDVVLSAVKIEKEGDLIVSFPVISEDD